MRSRWPVSAPVAAAALGLLFAAGCTGSSTARPTAPTSTAGERVIPSIGPTASSPPATAGSVLSCGNYIDSHASTTPLHVVLGVVALPVSPAVPALATALTGNGNGPKRLFAKTGLIIKPGTTFELVVPPAYADRLSIGWGGEPSIPGRRVVVSHCAAPGGSGWLAYPGGYWVDHPACVPIVVKTGNNQQQVHVGVGTSCPGQRPPQGPNQK